MKKTTQTSTRRSPKHIPQRTCIACREVKTKYQLIRLVYAANKDVVEIDPSGKMAGRGAYLCRSPVCWEKGLNKDRLDRALRNNISAENRTRLAQFGKML